MEESSCEKCRENPRTDIPVAPDRDSGHTFTAMYSVVAPKKSLQQTLLEVSQRISTRPGGSFISRLQAWASRQYCRPILWLHVQFLEDLVRTNEESFTMLADRRHLSKGFSTRPNVDTARRVREAQSFIVLPESHELMRYFPKLITRMNNAVLKLRDWTESLAIICPPDDTAAIEEARREYERGELIDFETFANGVHGAEGWREG